jgi:hypothetical protein
MPARCTAVAACSLVLLFILIGTGCTSSSIGDAAYRNGTLMVSVVNQGEPTDAFVQVTVYEIRDLHQEKSDVLQVPVTLRRGPNEVSIQKTLPPGRYKLYVYLLKPDERQTATIRDIVV